MARVLTSYSEIPVDGKPRPMIYSKQLAIDGAHYLKLKNPHADVTVRDLESVEETIVIQPQARRSYPEPNHQKA